MANNEFRVECERRRAAGFLVTGNTFMVRERLKAMGGFWDAYAKGWLMPNAEKAATARSLAEPRTAAVRAKRVSRSAPAPQVTEESAAPAFEAYPVSNGPVDAEMPFLEGF